MWGVVDVMGDGCGVDPELWWCVISEQVSDDPGRRFSGYLECRV